MSKGIRVIAGSARGRRLVVPPGDAVRPTKDMVREAMFSALDARGRLVDTAVLDLFAGSGALGIEALSRGASCAVFVERDRHAFDAITQNIETLDFGAQSRIVRGDVNTFVAGPPPPDAPFGLVCLDPPYDIAPERVMQVVAALTAPGWLEVGALVSMEGPVKVPYPAPPDARVEFERAFGDTLIRFLEL